MDKNIPHRLLFKVVLLIAKWMSFFDTWLIQAFYLGATSLPIFIPYNCIFHSYFRREGFNQFLVQEFFSWNFCPILLTCDSYNLVVRIPSFCPRVQHDNFFKFFNFSFHASRFWFRNSRSNRNNCPTSISCHVTVHYKRVAGRSGCNPVLSIRQ